MTPFGNTFRLRQNLLILDYEHMRMNYVNPKHAMLLSGSIMHENLMFYKFPKEIPPLTKSEAENCLCDLITKTATALQELHCFGYAHLDV